MLLDNKRRQPNKHILCKPFAINWPLLLVLSSVLSLSILCYVWWAYAYMQECSIFHSSEEEEEEKTTTAFRFISLCQRNVYHEAIARLRGHYYAIKKQYHKRDLVCGPHRNHNAPTQRFVLAKWLTISNWLNCFIVNFVRACVHAYVCMCSYNCYGFCYSAIVERNDVYVAACNSVDHLAYSGQIARIKFMSIAILVDCCSQAIQNRNNNKLNAISRNLYIWH